MSLQLLVTKGHDDIGQVFALEIGGSGYVIGRDEGCDIQLDDPSISRNHCRITSSGGRHHIEDLGSSWGTTRNGEPIQHCVLEPGDILTIGETELRVELISKSAAATLPPTSRQQQGGQTNDKSDPRDQKKSTAKETTTGDSSAPSRRSGSTKAQPSAAGQETDARRKTKSSRPSPTATAKPDSVKTAKDGELTSASLADLVGTTLLRFEIKDVLARARTGIVFKARDTKQNRDIALKLLWPELVQREEDVQRFVRAAKTMINIRHPNLVRLYGAGKSGGHCWTALELVDGQSLSQHVEELGRLEWKQVLSVGLQVAKGLREAESHGIVHRNVTPKNILASSDGSIVKLGDLMLAKAVEGTQAERVTKPGETVGDLPYLAPELLLDAENVDSRSDIYGLGATLYHAITGEPPFEGKALSDVLRQIQAGSVTPPSKRHIEVPAPFEAILMRMLSRDPDDRHADLDELVTDLEQVGATLGVSTVSAALLPEATEVAETDEDFLFEPPETPVSPKSANRQKSRNGRARSKRRKQNQGPIVIGSALARVLLVAGLIWAVMGGDNETDSQAKGESKTSSESPVAQKSDVTPDDRPKPTAAKTADNNQTKTVAIADQNTKTPTTTSPPNEPQLTELSIKDLIKLIEPSVVRFRLQTAEGEAIGSGFVIDKQGMVATNYHVIEDTQSAQAVFATGRVVPVVGVYQYDKIRDIAFIKVNAPADSLHPVKLATRQPEKGEEVLAFGAPLGLQFTASEGIVSAIRRPQELVRLGIPKSSGTWIQTTAPISPGNSGGPLVNRLGEVVAANTLTSVVGQNLNFAISAIDIRDLLSKPASLQPLSSVRSRTGPSGLAINAPDGPPDTLKLLQRKEIDPDVLSRIDKLRGKSRKLAEFPMSPDKLFTYRRAQSKSRFVEAYSAHGIRDSKWDQAAIAYLKNEPLDTDSETTFAKLNAVLDAGCRDPFILSLCIPFYIFESSEKGTDRASTIKRVQELAESAEAGLRDSKYPNHIQLATRVTLAQLNRDSPSAREIQSLLIKVIDDETLSSGEQADAFKSVEQAHESDLLSSIELLSAIQAAKSDSWLAHMTMGVLHRQLGWDARGSGTVNTVTRMGMATFQAHLSEAATHFVTAWASHPELPHAAYKMIGVDMAMRSRVPGTTRFWFEQAIEAERDLGDPYSAYLWSLRPRWGGGHRNMMDLGRECMETGWYQTSVPFQYHTALADVLSELPTESHRRVFLNPAIVAEYINMLQNYIKTENPVIAPDYLHSYIAAVLIATGRVKDFKQRYPDKMPPYTIEMGERLGFDLSDFAKLAVRSRPVRPERPPATGNQASEPPDDLDSHRKVAEWALEKQGRVTLGTVVGGRIRPGKSLYGKMPIPNEKFVVTGLSFQNRGRLTDSDFEILSSFNTLASFTLVGCPITDKTLLMLNQHSQLLALYLTGAKITDAGFTKLDCPNLASLHLNDLQIGDESVKKIAEFTHLSDLSMSEIDAVSDAGFMQIAPLKLRALTIADIPLTDASARVVSQMPSIAQLGFSGNKLTDNGLADLAKLKGLISLNIRKTAITDDGLRHLSDLDRLYQLILNETAVTDVGIQQLKSMKKLRIVNATGTSVTKIGAMQLQKAMPGLRVMTSNITR